MFLRITILELVNNKMFKSNRHFKRLVGCKGVFYMVFEHTGVWDGHLCLISVKISTLLCKRFNLNRKLNILDGGMQEKEKN